MGRKRRSGRSGGGWRTGRLGVLWPLLLPFCGDVARWKEEDEGNFGYRRRSRDVTGHRILTSDNFGVMLDLCIALMVSIRVFNINISTRNPRETNNTKYETD